MYYAAIINIVNQTLAHDMSDLEQMPGVPIGCGRAKFYECDPEGGIKTDRF